ncbi:MAG TPA: glycosyltransferase family 2 protein [Rhizomicrobium sp.]|nr:glycosyltransferase family 2 protein [Rhizomicrobium sp.]
MRVSVCICTYKRPGVIDTLNSIAAQHLPEGVDVEVIVVDNDESRFADALVRLWASDAPIPVTYSVEPKRNIAHARNRALSLASGEWIALIDDDEVADPDWLKALLVAAERYRADAVIGHVAAVYPSGAPKWFVAADPLSRRWGPSGTVCETGSTANALLAAKSVAALEFDPAFGRSGGEDTDFFCRLSAGGARIVVENSAVVRERIPPERLSASYLRRRAVRSGQSYGLIRLRTLSPMGRAGFFAAVLVKIAAFALAATALVVLARAASLKLAIRTWLNFGKLRALAGYPMPSLY